MESYNNLSDTELLYRINKSNSDHELIKKETIDLTYEIERLERLVNEKLKELENVEQNYVKLMEVMTSRQ